MLDVQKSVNRKAKPDSDPTESLAPNSQLAPVAPSVSTAALPSQPPSSAKKREPTVPPPSSSAPEGSVKPDLADSAPSAQAPVPDGKGGWIGGTPTDGAQKPSEITQSKKKKKKPKTGSTPDALPEGLVDDEGAKPVLPAEKIKTETKPQTKSIDAPGKTDTQKPAPLEDKMNTAVETKAQPTFIAGVKLKPVKVQEVADTTAKLSVPLTVVPDSSKLENVKSELVVVKDPIKPAVVAGIVGEADSTQPVVTEVVKVRAKLERPKKEPKNQEPEKEPAKPEITEPTKPTRGDAKESAEQLKRPDTPKVQNSAIPPEKIKTDVTPPASQDTRKAANARPETPKPATSESTVIKAVQEKKTDVTRQSDPPPTRPPSAKTSRQNAVGQEQLADDKPEMQPESSAVRTSASNAATLPKKPSAMSVRKITDVSLENDSLKSDKSDPANEKKKRKSTTGETEPGRKKKKKKKKSSALNPIEQAALNEGKKRVRRRTKLLEAELEEAGVKRNSNGKVDELYGLTVGNFFVLEDVLGKGGFGEARRGRHVVSNKKFAVKLERVSDGNDSLSEEYRIYQIIGQHLGFPRCYYFGVGPKEHNALVMDLLGPSLEDYFRAMERKWSLKMICQVALQVLDRIEYLHSKGYVYSDVKPENFLVGLAEEHQDSVIFLIDFGLAQQFKDKDTGKYCYDENMKTHPVGTMRYMSVRSHEGRSLSYRDDLESVGYLMIYMIRGRLPWQGTSIKDRLKKVKAVGMHKKNITMDELCQDCPQELQDYMKYVKSIQFYAEPRYEKLRSFFQSVLTSNSWADDGKFDWMGKSFDFAKNKKSDSGIVKPNVSGDAPAAVPSAAPSAVSEAAKPVETIEAPEAVEPPEVVNKSSKHGKKKKGRKKSAAKRKMSKKPAPPTVLTPVAETSPEKPIAKKEEFPKPAVTNPGTDQPVDPIQSYNDKGKTERNTKQAAPSHLGPCGCC